MMKPSAFFFLFFIAITFAIHTTQAQTFARQNSPYSRYGIGDQIDFQFMPSASMGGLNASYNSVMDYNPANPASLGHLRYTTFDIGVFYKHSLLKESSTSISTNANDGNLTYLSLAFPITRAWEIEKDSLRRALPIQWSMGFALVPHSTVGYDARVTRALPNIGDVEYKYTGNGVRYRANWANGLRYKGLSLGLNLGLLFGTINDLATIDFKDENYLYAFDEQILREEYTRGLLWDLGLQYDFYFKNKDGKQAHSLAKDKHLTLGFYAKGSNNMSVRSKEQQIRYGDFYNKDTILNTADTKFQMQLPLTIGAGATMIHGLFWKVGANYEASFWKDQFNFNARNINMGNSYKIAIGGTYTPIPRNLNIEKYRQRIQYRFGAHYGKDPRLVGSGQDAVQLNKYGATLGVGLPLKPLKSAVLGYVNIGLDVGYLGHSSLIGETYFKVNLALSLNDASWFRRSKFR